MRAQELFDKCKKLIQTKGEDYTRDPQVNQYENFDRAAEIASWFVDGRDKPYTVLIGTKLSRLATLLNGKSPKNESVEDSFIDLINYCALWAGSRLTGLEHTHTITNETMKPEDYKPGTIVPIPSRSEIIKDSERLDLDFHDRLRLAMAYGGHFDRERKQFIVPLPDGGEFCFYMKSLVADVEQFLGRLLPHIKKPIGV